MTAPWAKVSSSPLGVVKQNKLGACAPKEELLIRAYSG